MYEYRKKEYPKITIPDPEPEPESLDRYIDKKLFSGIIDSVGSFLKNIRIDDIILIALILIILKSDCCDNLLILALIYLLIG